MDPHTSLAFDSIGSYYDLLYKDKHYDSEVDYICSLFKRKKFEGSNILELGCGTGQHARLLANKGFDILGVEVNPTMLSKVVQSDSFQAVQGDARNFFTNRQFDIVLSLFHVLSYQVENSDLDSFFNTASIHLRDGGFFIFDCWFSPAVFHQGASNRIKRMSDQDFSILRLAEPNSFPSCSVVEVNFTIFVENLKTGIIQSFTELHPMRHFSISELDHVAKSHKFERIVSEEFLTGKPLSLETWGACFVYKKVN